MFYSQLNKICTEKGLKITNVLKELNIPTGSIGNWKNGAMPNSKVVIQLSTHLNVSCDYLLTGSEPKSSGNNEITELYNKLDEGDQREVIGYIKGMLKNEKYSQEAQKLA